MAEIRFEFEGMPYVIDTGGDEWTLVLRRSLAPVRDTAELDLLAHAHDALLPCRVTCDDDSITLHLTPGDGIADWAEVTRRPRADKLRALLNVGACAELVDRGYAVLLHPDNLVVDRNLRPRLAYRGLGGLMPPQGMDAQHFLRQYQALVLATFDPKTSFTQVLDGAMALKRSNDFEKAVTGAASVAELTGYLAGLYDETTATDAERLVRVGRRSHAVFKHSAIWLGLLAVAAGALAGYSAFVRAPFDALMLEADTRFVALDYDGVIETLRPVDEDRLPLTQRYALAYSYLRGTNLSGDQQTAIENSMSLNSEREFLTYWVQIGRGDLDDALDGAKKLDDVDLILYALTLRQEQVRADNSLSGTERESTLEELQSEYDKYVELRSTAIAEGDPESTGEGDAESRAEGDPGSATAEDPGADPASDDPAPSATPEA
ncbi:type VII secretion protein EssB [Cellulomonas sp. Marseille-Q8402]